MRPGAAAPAPIELVRPLLQHLADVAAAAEGRVRLGVPELAAHALGDQLAVLARDVLQLAAPSAGATGRAPLDDAAVADLADRLTALRRALP